MSKIFYWFNDGKKNFRLKSEQEGLNRGLSVGMTTKGRKCTKEQKETISKRTKEGMDKPEIKEKCAAWKGKSLSKEHKKHISESFQNPKNSLQTVKRFCCEDISKIEGYNRVISEKGTLFDCHHRLETHTSDGQKRLVNISATELKALDMYYNRSAEELIFSLKNSEKM